jgi:hypothetical protein
VSGSNISRADWLMLYSIGGLKSIGYVPISFGVRTGIAISPSPPSLPNMLPSSSRTFMAACIALLVAFAAIAVHYLSSQS